MSRDTGFWPLNYSLCNVWVTADVLCCSSSIYHMVFISIGRFIGIRNPLRARQTLSVSRRAVVYKIAAAWILSALISCPITILALLEPTNIQPNGTTCAINNQYFLIFGESLKVERQKTRRASGHVSPSVSGIEEMRPFVHSSSMETMRIME